MQWGWIINQVVCIWTATAIKQICTNYYCESHEKLAKAQRKLARRKGSKKGEEQSNNYKKQKKRVAKIHKHISNQRLDELHKKSTGIANQYDVVCVESLNMKAISNKGFGNGKATLDNGYGLFLRMLGYKLSERGKYLVKVDKFYRNHSCAVAVEEKKLKLTDGVYKCRCGIIMDRDYNAAVNI